MTSSWQYVRSGLGFLVTLCVAIRARAALYGITIEGTVTHSAYIDVAVGDPFTIRYTADGTDLDPRPTVGQYAVVQRAVATLPHGTIMPPLGDDIYLGANNPGFLDTFDAYYSMTVNGPFQVLFAFSRGTLPSDALPLSLPLETATFAQWNFGGDLGENLIGKITSYEGVEVPEPCHLMGLLTLFPSALRRRP